MCRIFKLWYNLEQEHTTTGFVLAQGTHQVCLQSITRISNSPKDEVVEEFKRNKTIILLNKKLR